MSPITMKYSSATLVNLSILTGNVYNLCWGLFLFDYKVSYLQEIHSRASIIIIRKWYVSNALKIEVSVSLRDLWPTTPILLINHLFTIF